MKGKETNRKTTQENVMDVWIETTAGTLVKASSTTHISMRQTDSGWDVSVSASAAPAPFATGLADKDTARTVRNTLALGMSTASSAEAPQVVVYDDENLTVSSYTLAA
jgi:hypothetical protein